MKIQDRIKSIEGVDDAHWDSRQNRLVVYYWCAYPLEEMKIKVASAIGEAALQNAIDSITFISTATYAITPWENIKLTPTPTS